jgi:hypothetical protein
MKLKLTFHERFAVNALLPVKGNFAQVTRLREVRDALTPTDAEKEQVGYEELKDENGDLTGAAKWDREHFKTEHAVEIGQSMFGQIVTILTKLDDKEELSIGQATLYEKFIEPGPEKTEAKAT